MSDNGNEGVAPIKNRPGYWSAIYIVVGVTIGLGAFGHGAQGTISLEPTLAGAAVPTQMAEVLRIVWYFVSGCMLAFGYLIVMAWFAARRGVKYALAAPGVIGTLYLLTGIAAFGYQHNPFWLLFLVQGMLLLLSIFGLRRRWFPRSRSEPERH